MDTKSKTHEANPQKGFVVQINASENFGLVPLAFTPGFSSSDMLPAQTDMHLIVLDDDKSTALFMATVARKLGWTAQTVTDEIELPGADQRRTA